MQTDATQIRKPIHIRGDLHDRAKRYADMHHMKLGGVGDQAFELFLSTNEETPIRKVSNANKRNR
jgi:hypothetical protein